MGGGVPVEADPKEGGRIVSAHLRPKFLGELSDGLVVGITAERVLVYTLPGPNQGQGRLVSH